MRRTVLFDLDGTLIDSARGVYTSLRHAMERVGLTPVDREEVRHFLGTPLPQVLVERFGHSMADAQAVLEAYLPHYRDVGLYETAPAPGMRELVSRLHSRGFRLAIASCKPHSYCRPTLEVCGFPPCFEAVVGSGSNGVPEEKGAVIREALRLLGAHPDEAVMVGDRAGDVAGARACGIPCVGVELCGYSDPGELARAGADAIAGSAGEVEDILTRGALCP